MVNTAEMKSTLAEPSVSSTASHLKFRWAGLTLKRPNIHGQDGRRHSSIFSAQRLNSYFVRRASAIWECCICQSYLRSPLFTISTSCVIQRRHLEAEGKATWNREGMIFSLTALDCCQLSVRRLQWGYIREWTLSTYHISSITGWAFDTAKQPIRKIKTVMLRLASCQDNNEPRLEDKIDFLRFITSSQSATPS